MRLYTLTNILQRLPGLPKLADNGL